MNDHPADPALAMQTRCPRCLGEQYVLNVIAFSKGETGCTACGHTSKPMTYGEWHEALRQRTTMAALLLADLDHREATR